MFNNIECSIVVKFVRKNRLWHLKCFAKFSTIKEENKSRVQK